MNIDSTFTLRSRGRRWQTTLRMAILLLGVGIVLASAWFCTQRLEFTPANWQMATPNQRDALMAQLASTTVLRGCSVGEIVRMLGPPDEWDERLIYELGGRADDYSAASPALVINIESNGRIKVVSGSAIPEQVTSQVFEPERWESADSQARQEMARGLSKSKAAEFKGIPSEVLIGVLGEPSRRTRPRMIYYGRKENANGEMRKRFSGPKLFITLEDDRATEVAFEGS